MKFNSLIPELMVSDVGKSIEFYKKLGFKLEYERKENNFAFLSFEKSQIMIQKKQDDEWKTGELEYPFGRGINFQIEVKDAEALYKKAKAMKLKIKIKLEDNGYRVDNNEVRCREFLIQDPDGYLLRFSQTL